MSNALFCPLNSFSGAEALSTPLLAKLSPLLPPPPSSSSSEASLCSLPLKPKQGLRSVVVPSRLSSVQAGYAIPQQRTRALNVMAFPPLLSSVRRRRPRAEEGGTLQIDVCQMQREGGGKADAAFTTASSSSSAFAVRHGENA